MDDVARRATELVEEFPEAPTRTLARRLSKEFAPWLPVESARSKIRYRRGNQGVKHRKNATDKTNFRKKGKAGWAPKMPPSKAESWEPYKLSGERIGVLSDVHIPYHDELALASAVKKLKGHKIDCLLLNGDYGDWYTVSRWQKNPKKRNLKDELKLQKEGLVWLRHEFPKAEIVFKNGNHEDRWDHYLWNHAPDISDLDNVRMDQLLDFESLGIEWVTEERPVMAGDLPIFHGHELPRGLTNPVNMARGAFLRAVHTILVGHGHRTSGHAESGLWHDEIFCWSQGCLCDMRPKYARINKWNHGFVYIDVSEDGTVDVANYRIAKDGTVRK